MVGKNEKITALEAHEALALLARLERSVNKSYDMTILLSAEECVKKQIPEMVLEQKDPHKCGVYHGRCPDCGSNGVDSDRHKFCPCCGKALLWKEPWTD